MSSIGKIFVVLNLVFSLVILGVVGSILSKSNDYRKSYDGEVAARAADNSAKDAEIDKLQQDVKTLNGDKRQNDERITALTTTVASLEGDKAKLNGDLDTLRGDLAKLQSDYQKFTSTLESLRSHNEALVKENGEMRDAKVAAEGKQVAAEQDLARANAAIESLNAEVAGLKDQIDALQSANGEAAAQIEAAIQAGFDISKVRAQPQLDGIVQSVNPALQIVVLSVGADVGVTRGMKFAIYGGGQYKGEVVVNDVYPDNCSARILPNVRGTQASIAANDKATTRL